MKLYIEKSECTGKEFSVVLDDLILTKDLPTSAGSKMLDGYKSLFEAEVVSKLSAAGYEIAGKANVGEFGIDFLGETSYYGACVDEDKKLCSASAELLKNKDAVAAINFDVNGAPRRAAALAGLTFIKPTYGVVSRYGTIPVACSGETVGVMADTADTCSRVLDVIAGHDAKDGTSLPEDMCQLVKMDSSDKSVKKIAVLKSMMQGTDEETQSKIETFKEVMQKNNISVEEIDDDVISLSQVAWNILMAAEVCNNVSRYDGVKFGYRTENYSNIYELYTNSRTEAFGFLLKTVILYGSNVLSTENYMKVYDKALRMRRVIREKFDEIFEKFDAVLLPACSKTVYDEADVLNKELAYEESYYTAPASITGLPVVVTGGVQLVGNVFSDKQLLEIAKICEKES